MYMYVYIIYIYILFWKKKHGIETPWFLWLVMGFSDLLQVTGPKKWPSSRHLGSSPWRSGMTTKNSRWFTKGSQKRWKSPMGDIQIIQKTKKTKTMENHHVKLWKSTISMVISNGNLQWINRSLIHFKTDPGLIDHGYFPIQQPFGLYSSSEAKESPHRHNPCFADQKLGRRCVVAMKLGEQTYPPVN